MGNEDATVYRADEQMQLFFLPLGMENTYASQARIITKNLQPHNANLRGVADKKFFLFRIANLYDYPH